MAFEFDSIFGDSAFVAWLQSYDNRLSPRIWQQLAAVGVETPYPTEETFRSDPKTDPVLHVQLELIRKQFKTVEECLDEAEAQLGSDSGSIWRGQWEYIIKSLEARLSRATFSEADALPFQETIRIAALAKMTNVPILTLCPDKYLFWQNHFGVKIINP